MTIDRLFSVAPMMDCTDRHFRYFMRLLSSRVLLYTEMITTGAILFGQRDRFLAFTAAEQPLAIQLGGADPEQLAKAAYIAEQYAYAEINLNIGCPSDRVKAGKFGACLMTEPLLVADCVAAIKSRVKIPVTVKTRVGVDERDSYEELCQFIAAVQDAGCETFIIHARKAWLNGLSPKENRTIPPLQYNSVYQLKRDFPELEIIINGGITTISEVQQHLPHVDGVMIGREAYSNPYFIAELEQALFPDYCPPSRDQALTKLLPYIDDEINKGTKMQHITRHILGLYQGLPGARSWRGRLSAGASLRTTQELTFL